MSSVELKKYGARFPGNRGRSLIDGGPDLAGNCGWSREQLEAMNLAFHRAMMRERERGTEAFLIGVCKEPGTDRPITFCPDVVALFRSPAGQLVDCAPGAYGADWK